MDLIELLIMVLKKIAFIGIKSRQMLVNLSVIIFILVLKNGVMIIFI